jgi:ATP-dependent DNA helicase RecG
MVAVELAEIVADLRAVGVEFEDVEVKRASGGVPQSLAETMSAFANTRGGIIILGLDERAGFAAVGVSDPAAVRDEVAGVARSKLTPALAPSIEIVPFEGAALVVVEIGALPLSQRPCYVTTRGVYNGAFIRVGDGDQRLTPYEIDRLRENAGQPRWDEELVSQATTQDLDQGAVLRLIAAARRNSPQAFAGLTEQESLVRLGVLVPDEDALIPSLAGLLSVGAYPQQFFPQLMVSLAVYPNDDPGEPGPGGIRFLDSAAVGGNVPTMVNDAVQAVLRNLRRASRIVGVGREDLWEIGPDVIREAIVNALMHRDYSPQSRGTQIQIELFPDRLTVTSPGGLFGNVRLETLGESRTSTSRNARLAALLQEAGDPFTGRPVAENRGSGIRLMISQVRRDTGVVPLFSANLDFFRVTIPRTSPVTSEFREWAAQLSGGLKLSQAQISALALAKAGYHVDAALMRRLGLNAAGARRELGQLVDLGFLLPRKARDDGSYRLSPGLPEASAGLESERGNSVGSRIFAVLNEAESLTREELQQATGASRSGVTRALDELIANGLVEATAPPRSPNRRYRRKG